MKPRIDLVPTAEAQRLGKEFGINEAQAGRSAFRMLAHHPDLVKHVYGLLLMLSQRGKLPARLRELMIMRIGWVTGTDYEWFQHYRIAQEAGVTPDEIVALREWKDAKVFSAPDRAVLAAVDDTIAAGKVSDATWAQCEREIKEPAQLVEMVVMIGNWMLFSMLIKTLGVPLEPGSVAWPPDGKVPPSAQ